MIVMSGNNTLVDTDTGEIIAHCSPIFGDRSYNDNVADKIPFLEPMTAQELDEDKLKKHIEDNETVAEQKFDGHRGLIHLTPEGNRLFSRRVSKDGWFSENTDQIPHIRDTHKSSEYYGTIIDGEVLLPIAHCTCRDVQSVTGAKLDKAITYQLNNGFAFLSAFDILYYKGINVMRMPYWKRKLLLLNVIEEMNSPFIRFCQLYATKRTHERLAELSKGKLGEHLTLVEDYEELFRNFLKEGKEGLIIKNINAIYEQKRTKSFVKMKAHKTYDCVIMGYDDPTEVVDFTKNKTKPEDWLYWESNEKDIFHDGMPKNFDIDEICPVTKFYAYGWIGAIVFGVWKDGELVEVGRASGMDEEVRREISENKQKYLGTVVEIEAQGIINEETGSLQHPRFICFREDKGSEQCTFSAHIREDK